MKNNSFLKLSRLVMLLTTCSLFLIFIISSCGQEDLKELEETAKEQGPPSGPTGEEKPLITEFNIPDTTNVAVDRNGYWEYSNTTVWVSGWQMLVDGGNSSLLGKDVKVEITPNATVNFKSIQQSPQVVLEEGNVWSGTTGTREVLQSQLAGSQNHADFYAWASTGNTCNVRVLVRNSSGGGNGGGGGSNTPPFSCGFNAPNFPGSFSIGIEAGQPIGSYDGDNLLDNVQFNSGGTNFDVFDLVDDSEAKFVRLNFFRPGYDNDNASDNWLLKYDPIVCEFNRRGIPIYAVVTDVVAGDNSTDGYNQNSNPSAWINHYVDNFEKIVQRYQNNIRVYESFNEPNVWVGGVAKMSEASFAELLEKTYRRLKPNGNNPYSITLISGPLEANDAYPTNPNGPFTYTGAADYFQNVVNSGETNYQWKYNTGFPFDAVGYHIYVRKKAGGATDLKIGIQASLDAIIAKLDNGWNNIPVGKRQLYISELGWNAKRMTTTNGQLDANVTTQEEGQANFISRGLEKLKANSSRVKAVSFFSTLSFDNEEWWDIEDFGLTRPSGLGNLPAGFKDKCWCVYKRMIWNWSAQGARSNCGVSNYVNQGQN